MDFSVIAAYLLSALISISPAPPADGNWSLHVNVNIEISGQSDFYDFDGLDDEINYVFNMKPESVVSLPLVPGCLSELNDEQFRELFMYYIRYFVNLETSRNLQEAQERYRIIADYMYELGMHPMEESFHEYLDRYRYDFGHDYWDLYYAKYLDAYFSVMVLESTKLGNRFNLDMLQDVFAHVTLLAEDIEYIMTVDEYGYMTKNELQLSLVFDLPEWAAAYQIVLDNLDYHFETIKEEFPDSFYEDDWDYFRDEFLDEFRDEFILEVEEWLLADPVVVTMDIVIMFDATGSDYQEVNTASRIKTSEITIFIPRELFFTGGSESGFLAYFEESGGVIAQLEDQDAFWRNHPENAGEQYIEVSFSQLDFESVGKEIEDEIFFYLDSIAGAFESISGYEKETNEAATRVIFTADLEEMAEEQWGFIYLLDFVFPQLGQLEYLRRIFFLYDMAYLEEIVFYVEDSVTSESIKIYSFFLDAPLGLSMRHGVGVDD